MSYFLKKSVNKYLEEDNSYPSPEKQLRWRLEELQSRLEELENDEFAYENPLILMEDDIRYALPEHLCSIRHIIKAIEFAEADLQEKNHKEKPVLIFRLPESIYQYASLA